MPKWPFGSQKVKVECATKQRTTFAFCQPTCPTHHPQQQQAKRCPPPPRRTLPKPSARQSPSPARNGLLVCQCMHCTHWRALLVIPANKTFITIGYSGNVGLLPKDRNANARDKQVEHFVRQRRPRLNQVASAVPHCPSVSVRLSGRLCLHMSAAACRAAPNRSSYVKTFWLGRKVQIKKAPTPQRTCRGEVTHKNALYQPGTLNSFWQCGRGEGRAAPKSLAC